MITSLYTFRCYRNLSLKEVCDKIGISEKEYESIEKGIRDIDIELAHKFSEFYNAPPEIFRMTRGLKSPSINYSHNNFEASNAYVHNLYQNDFRIIEMLSKVKDDEIQLLKDEVFRLRNQNTRLLNLLFEYRR